MPGDQDFNKTQTPVAKFESENTEEQLAKVDDMKEFIGRNLSEVEKAVEEKYSGQYTIPGNEEADYLVENPDKVPEILKDGNEYYFMKSDTRFQGKNGILCVIWKNDKLISAPSHREGEPWRKDYRVVLFKKNN